MPLWTRVHQAQPPDFPATGLLTTVDDLAKYMIALDQNALLTPESYAHMTQPFVLNDGRHSPYGLGWSTQVINGQSVHWHYGYGDSFSALLIRVPEKKVSFILLSKHRCGFCTVFSLWQHDIAVCGGL